MTHRRPITQPSQLTTLGALAACAAIGSLAGCGAEGPAGFEGGESLYEVKICARGATTEGIDVSRWQDNIDWSRVKGAGIEFAVIKASEGTTFIDPNFTANWSGAKSHGIIRGAYHFFRPSIDAAAQATHFVNVVKGAGWTADVDLPFVADVEVTDSVAGGVVSARALVFLQRVEALTGRLPMIYTYPSFFDGTMGKPVGFDKYPLWIANWGTNCPSVPGFWKDWPFWQYTSTGSVAGIGGDVDRDVFNGSLADLRAWVGVTPPVQSPPPLPHQNSNDALSVVSRADGGLELFALTAAGESVLVSTRGAADDWGPLSLLDGEAACGAAASFWGGAWLKPELYSPRTIDTTGLLRYASGAWSNFVDFGGAGLGLGRMQTLVFRDGTTEVFALGRDGAIHHNGFSAGTSAWSGWSTIGGLGGLGGLGGTFRHGPGAILWEDDHAEIFAVDDQGDAWHAFTAADHGAFGSFARLAPGTLASPLVPVRNPDKFVEVFARGADGHLQSSKLVPFKGWQPFETVDTTTVIQGTPSAIANPKQAGPMAPGPLVFARDQEGRVVHTYWDGAAYSPFAPIADLRAGSDPLGHVRRDGAVVVFVVDEAGTLRRAVRASSGVWGGWKAIGAGLSTCAQKTAALAPDLAMNGGMADAAASDDTDAGDGDLGGMEESGCSCDLGGRAARAGRGGGGPGWAWPAAIAAALWVARRRRHGGRSSRAS